MLSADSTMTIGILLLALVTVGYGGHFLTRVVRGSVPANDLQRSFFRAGHAHAGMLLILGIVILLALDRAGLQGWWRFIAGSGVPAAAILMPAGFFLSVAGRDPEKPNPLVWLLWVGVASLTAGLLTAGIALTVAGVRGLS